MSEATVTATGDDLTEAMRDVVDPELGINVVDLGLVYGITVDEANTAIIDMTLTSAACPLTGKQSGARRLGFYVELARQSCFAVD